jgi:hypothetical protein
MKLIFPNFAVAPFVFSGQKLNHQKEFQKVSEVFKAQTNHAQTNKPIQKCFKWFLAIDF